MLGLQVQEPSGQQTLFEQLLCQKYIRKAAGVTVHSLAEHIPAVLLKQSVNNRPTMADSQ